MDKVFWSWIWRINTSIWYVHIFFDNSYLNYANSSFLKEQQGPLLPTWMNFNLSMDLHRNQTSVTQGISEQQGSWEAVLCDAPKILAILDHFYHPELLQNSTEVRS